MIIQTCTQAYRLLLNATLNKAIATVYDVTHIRMKEGVMAPDDIAV